MEKHLVIGGPLHGCYIEEGSAVDAERTPDFTRPWWRNRGLPDEKPYRYTLAKHRGRGWLVPTSNVDLNEAILAAQGTGIRPHVLLLEAVRRNRADAGAELPSQSS